MTLTTDTSESYVFEGIRTWLLTLFPGEHIVQGQQNRIAAPATPNYIVMWPGTRARLASNQSSYDFADGKRRVSASTSLRIQVDCHGADSGDMAQAVMTLWRDFGASEYFKNHYPQMAALDCSDPVQVPFINDEKTYENRWTIYLIVQIAPSISTIQDFAASMQTNFLEVDADFPPE